MIKPEIDLELSINALKVYGIEPNIIKSMLSNLQKIVNKNCNIPHVSVNEVAVCLKPEHVICCLMQNGLCTEDVFDCKFRQTER